MEKWICNVCGYTHKGKNAPERCPQCGASKALFSRRKMEKNGCVFSLLTIVFIFIAPLVICLACNSSKAVNNSAVSIVELNRYLGKWYEIARLDHGFERNMTHCTASYTLNEDGSIRIVNRGLRDGKWHVSEGKAKTTIHPGILRVSFWGPFYSDYRIMMLASDYSYALVGSDSDYYLWILARTPQLKTDVREKILHEAHRRGYKTEDLIWVDQGAGQ